ncbi:Poly(U)-specific endoribonuclease-like protein [Armadillidium vulgare]|nr:Poly(U)-specific endoribonuclease-like protein [Armadillidium vulgare]
MTTEDSTKTGNHKNIILRFIFCNFNGFNESIMKYILIFIAVFLTECNCCWKKSEPSTLTTTTTTTTPLPPVEEENRASKIHETDAAKTGPRSGVETAELRNLSEELYKLDTNSVDLFTSNTADPKEPLTLRLFRRLLDNYVASVKTPEENTKEENNEINAFLDAVIATPLMIRLEEFLKQKKLLQGRLRPALYHIWFTPYSRSPSVIGSSGFEHVFLGEIKKSQVSGFHNWLFFEKEEQEKDINYKGYMTSLDLGDKGEILKMRFDWMNYTKPVGSIL